MPKANIRLRGPTRPLETRLTETKMRVELLENRKLRADLDKDARDLRRKIFRKGG